MNSLCDHYGSRVEGCSRSDCVVAPRCPDCKHNFVKQENLLCNECVDDFRCASCKNPAKYAFAKQAPAPRVGELVCEYCVEKPKIEHWTAAASDVCQNCKQPKTVNAAGFCQDCHGGFEQYSTQCYKCHQFFTATYKGDTHCATCKEKCHGCGNWFSPINRLQQYCNTCMGKLAKNICLGCGNKYRYDSRQVKLGYCSTCLIPESGAPTERFYCPICEVVEVVGPETACPKCLVKKISCPSCGKEEIYAAEWICKKCRKKRS